MERQGERRGGDGARAVGSGSRAKDEGVTDIAPAISCFAPKTFVLLVSLQLLERALSCSVDMLSHSSQKGALEVDVMMHTAHCLGVAAQFPACRQALAIMQGLSRDLCRGLYFDVSVGFSETLVST
ncbi:hypothetical protein HPB51_024534 [Rhipicephalus microplus]|uniref:Uncharacterized protein n=1 Tax=Rhipicephalus microplus TaxID=6941 RepID=A0A9J6DKB2_RHIMP|nr:hypothetical protein HPB51_024534 [Rhipicephalus microplus]